MTTVAMYVASLALLATPPADTADSMLDTAQAVPTVGDDKAAVPDDAYPDTARTAQRGAHGRRAVTRADDLARHNAGESQAALGSTIRATPPVSSRARGPVRRRPSRRTRK